MLNSKKMLEKFLQQQRFKKVLPYLKGDILDFGGNEGELKPFVQGTYTLVNYDHAAMEDGRLFDTIVALAVIEHINVESVHELIKRFKIVLQKGGCLFISTPTPLAKPILELMAYAGLLDKQNIREHKHYWNKHDLMKLAEGAGFKILKYQKFQLGFNQFALLTPKL
jgi:2-polyprenyl-3-methyl-5-hydroxy-6-metoxy-1,4-benzoquinol methylase